VELGNNVNQLLESNRELARRLMNLEDAFDAQSLVSRRRSVAVTPLDPRHNADQLPVESPSESDKESPSATRTAPASGFAFEIDLEASRPYRRALRDTMDFSFRSSVARSNAWSVFSGLSLSDVSIMSVIALPIYADEIGNSHHYDFGSRQPALSPSSAPVISDSGALPSSFLREFVEIKLQLSQFRGFADLFAQEEVRRPTHPFFALRGIFRTGDAFLLLAKLLGLRIDTSDILPGSATVLVDKIVILLVIEAFRTALPLEPDEVFTADDALGSRSTPFFKVSSAPRSRS